MPKSPTLIDAPNTAVKTSGFAGAIAHIPPGENLGSSIKRQQHCADLLIRYCPFKPALRHKSKARKSR